MPEAHFSDEELGPRTVKESTALQSAHSFVLNTLQKAMPSNDSAAQVSSHPVRALCLYDFSLGARSLFILNRTWTLGIQLSLLHLHSDHDVHHLNQGICRVCGALPIITLGPQGWTRTVLSRPGCVATSPLHPILRKNHFCRCSEDNELCRWLKGGLWGSPPF